MILILQQGTNLMSWRHIEQKGPHDTPQGNIVQMVHNGHLNCNTCFFIWSQYVFKSMYHNNEPY